jgi:hypothetical protein
MEDIFMPSFQLPLGMRVAALRRALANAKDLDTALVTLAEAGTDALRKIEGEYFPGGIPFGITVLRERLAEETARRNGVQAKATGTSLVTAETVKGWLLGTLADAMPGYTDYDHAKGGSYRVSVAGPPAGTATAGVLHLRVSTRDGADARLFRAVLAVTEVPPTQPAAQAAGSAPAETVRERAA